MQSEEQHRVLVLDIDDARRAATCAILEREGYEAAGANNVHALAQHFDDSVATVLVFDVSMPRTWQAVVEEHAALRAFVADRVPIVLHGNRPVVEFSELDWACRAVAHIPSHPEGRHLLALLRRLLPRTAPRAPSRTTRPPSGERFALAGASTRMLLIDDSEITLEMMQSLLSAVGFDVRIAVALGEVTSIVANWSPSVIVADVKRPDMRGDELCARLKASVHNAEAVVLLCSSMPEAELAELARSAHADGYLTKSNGLEHFLNQLVAWTQQLVPPPRSQNSKVAR